MNFFCKTKAAVVIWRKLSELDCAPTDTNNLFFKYSTWAEENLYVLASDEVNIATRMDTKVEMCW